MPKVFIVNSNQQYDEMFRGRGWGVVHSITDADLVQFTGGSDVNPLLYGETKHPKTHSDGARDVREKDIYIRALEKDIPMAGICRGAQFLNVMNGGKLYQHVDNHAISGTHTVGDLDTSTVINVTSTHHQMMRPSDSGRVLAICRRSTMKERMDDSLVVINTTPEDDVEVVYYQTTECLCFQPHPEFAGGPCQDYYFDLLDRYLQLNTTEGTQVK